MTSPKLQVCIATGQNLANLIPAIQCKAEEVWILQTPAMRTSASHLSDALKRRGIRVRRIDFIDDDVATIHTQAEGVAEQLDGKAVTVNVTGGTKLMTLALVETLATQLATGKADLAPHLVYTDTRHQRLDWLRPRAKSDPMEDILEIDDVLFAQGYRRAGGAGGPESAQWMRAVDGRSKLTRMLGDEAASGSRVLRAVNAMMSRALSGHNGFDRDVHLDYPPGGSLSRILDEAAGVGLLHRADGTHLVLQDREAAVYLGGGWVEEFAAARVSAARIGGVPRLEIESVDSGAKNEIDVVALKRNRMLLIECKAARPDEKVSDWIYKISQLSLAIGGQFAQALLLSATDLQEEHCRRAREYGVDVLAGAELGKLSSYLRTWAKS